MQPLAFLRCVGKALVRHAGNALGLGFGGDILAKVGEEVWKDWQRERNALERREELQAIAQAAAAEVRVQVEAVVREVAAEQPAAVRDSVARYLERIPPVVRSKLRRPEDPSGTTVPPDFSIVTSQDLLRLISLDWVTAPPDSRQGRGNEPAPTEPKQASPAAVVLSVVQGPLRGRRFVFEDRNTCLIGRDTDCQARLPDKGHLRISRRHCLLDINPPELRVRDFGSMNGTFVNDELIGKRAEGMTPEEGARLRFPEKDLKNGDRLTLAETVFQVEVRGVVAATEAYPQGRRCSRCGGDVMDEAGDRAGVFLCAECRSDPEQLAKHLAALANVGQPDPALRPLKGYRVVKTLGQGGMGAVFLLGSEPGKDWLALKLMLPRVAADERARARFLREIDAARALRHRHVVPLRDAGECQGTFFFTMEYCDSGSAHDLQRQRGGKLPLDEAVEITLQALEGLEYAHNVFGPGNGLVHRDLSPHNLLLSGSGAARIAKIGDYGLAKAFDQAGLSGLTRTGDAAGKPHFMPRQQVVDFKYAKPAVDVWAMAACLYSMLTGAAPRDFPAGKDKWLVLLESEPVPIRQRDAKVPDELAEVIDRALVDGREKLHYATAAEFKEALERAS